MGEWVTVRFYGKMSEWITEWIDVWMDRWSLFLATVSPQMTTPALPRGPHGAGAKAEETSSVNQTTSSLPHPREPRHCRQSRAVVVSAVWAGTPGKSWQV